MTPVMYLAQGTVWEKSQRTHFWNNTKFKKGSLRGILSTVDCVDCAGDENACLPLWLGFFPRFHIPVLGGWRKFVVFDVSNLGPWHIGWVTSHGFVGVSRIPLSGPVRMTIGPGDSTFFAVKNDGTIYRLEKIGEGLIGQAGEFRHVPLL
jgi:hypothetical protein